MKTATDLRNELGSALCSQQREIRDRGFQSARTFNKINKLQKQYKEITGSTLWLIDGNIKQK